jgi:hypothetical protein
LGDVETALLHRYHQWLANVAVIDRRVEFHSTLDHGMYSVTGYYRTCDGHCGMLDPPNELCTATLEVRPGESPTVVVSVEHQRCTVEQG